MTAVGSAAAAGLPTSLDGEVVVSALVGEREPDLLHSERQPVDRVREFSDGRIAMRPELTHFRCGALAILDAFEDQFASAAEHDASPSFVVGDDLTVGDGPDIAAHAAGGAR